MRYMISRGNEVNQSLFLSDAQTGLRPLSDGVRRLDIRLLSLLSVSRLPTKVRPGGNMLVVRTVLCEVYRS